MAEKLTIKYPPPIQGLLGWVSHHVLSDAQWDEWVQTYSERSESDLRFLFENYVLGDFMTEPEERQLETKSILQEALTTPGYHYQSLYEDLAFPFAHPPDDDNMFENPKFVLQVLWSVLFKEPVPDA